MTGTILLEDAFGRIQEIVHRSVKGLSLEDLAYRPNHEANSIAWLVWHLTRVQDDHIADVAKTEQVWTEANWYERFDLPFDKMATGYGHTTKEVAAVQVSGKLLLSYYDAVHKRTIEFIDSLKDKDFQRIVDRRWDPPVTMAVRLVSIISDDLQHAGQAAYLHGLIK